jgi:hypothetical protein
LLQGKPTGYIFKGKAIKELRDAWRWDRQVLSKRRQQTTNPLYVKSQKSEGLKIRFVFVKFATSETS